MRRWRLVYQYLRIFFDCVMVWWDDLTVSKAEVLTISFYFLMLNLSLRSLGLKEIFW